MFIITENGVINSEQIFAFRIVSNNQNYPGYKISGCQLRAFHSGYIDENGSEDYFLVKAYKENDEAKSDLNRIIIAYQNGDKTVDLR